ncbi:MAG: TetR/AcrR family transcriptional regulator [Sporichthyaceae bacterium]
MSASSPRDQMVEAASRLFAKQGYRSTTMRGIVDESGAPWGSLAHYWPGGKEQIGVAAIQYGDQRVRGAIEFCLQRAQTPGEAVAQYLALVGDVLEGSGWETGCPVTTVALEVASDGSPVAEACVAAFNGWCAAWAAGFRAAGIKPARARDLATSVVGGAGGALIQSRVLQTKAPMRLAAESLRTLLDSAVAGS